MKTFVRSLTAVAVFLLIFIFTESCSTSGDRVRVEDMRCEYLSNPPGVDVSHPRFSWILTGSRRGLSQTAYRIVVTGTSAQKEKVWDSGKVFSGRSVNISYRGKPLVSGEKYIWTVDVWDDKGHKATPAKTAWFQTGLLNRSDWKAKWITAGDTAVSAPLLRKEFTVDKKIRFAWVYVTGLGQYELYLNGEKTGDHVLDPARTDFRKRVLYATYDVTDRLKRGKNALGIILGNGTYRVVSVKGRYGWSGHKPRTLTPRALMQLNIIYADGSRDLIVTDGSWKSSSGPITFNHVYGGEDYDARLEQPGWATPGFDDSGWGGVRQAGDPGVILKSQLMPPIKVVQTIEPVAVTYPEPGVVLFDLGQNFAGWWRIRVKGDPGVTVRVRGAETLNDSLFPEPLRPGDRLSTKFAYHARVWTDYTLKGKSMEVYEPRFFYTGFRFAEVRTEHPERIDSLYLEGRVVHSALEPAGTFASSDSLLNRIWRAARWSQKSNQHGVPTDCPHREKGGYNGDGEIIAETSIHDFRMASFYTKWLNDMRDSQYDNGRIPNTSPTLIGGNGGGIAWGSAYVLIPWWMYRYYADTTILATHYVTMKKYLAYLHHLAKSDANPSEAFIINAFGGYWDSLGEWCAPGQSDGPNHPVVNTAYYFLDAWTFSKIAGVLGHKRDAVRYLALADSVKGAFIHTFFNPETRLFGTDSLYQTYQVLALALNLVPEAYREQTIQDLADDIMITHNGHLNTGIIGTKYLWPVLAHAGRNDIARDIIAQITFPGYGYWLSRGATTLWEEWDGKDSHNHQMFGTVSEFLYKYLAGIRSPMDGGTTDGYAHIHIQPFLPADLSFVKASVETVHGTVLSEWHQTPHQAVFHVKIPANTTASVSLPVTGFRNITVAESGHTVWKDQAFIPGREGIGNATEEKNHITFSVLSGSYDFIVTGR